VFSASTGLLSKSHGIEPHHLQSPANHYFSLQKKNPINLSNCKHEIRHHPRLFLSDNDDSVVLPDQLRPALPIDLVPLTLRGSRCALFSVLHQQSASDLFHQIHFSLRRAPFPYFISPIAQVVSTEPLTIKD